VVGEPERRLIELRRALSEIADMRRAVEQRVLGRANALLFSPVRPRHRY
jgi:hypothetical protein